MTSRYIKQPDLLMLWVRAAGKCSICKRDLLMQFEKSGNVKLGECAHIIPHSPYGPRGDCVTQGNNDYENLILLCGYHHDEIDKAYEDYTRERLLEIKQKHEDDVRGASPEDGNITLARSLVNYLRPASEIVIIPTMLLATSRFKSWSRIVPKPAMRMLGGTYGYFLIIIDLKNIGKNQAGRVTLSIDPMRSKLPNEYTISTTEPITSSTSPSQMAEIKSECDSLNVGELKRDVCRFYLNYRSYVNYEIPRAAIGEFEFAYHLTCDSEEPSKGVLKIINV